MHNVTFVFCFFFTLSVLSLKNGERKSFMFQTGFNTLLLLLQVVNTHSWPYMHINVKSELFQFNSESHTFCQLLYRTNHIYPQWIFHHSKTNLAQRRSSSTGARVLIYFQLSWAQVTVHMEFPKGCSPHISVFFSAFSQFPPTYKKNTGMWLGSVKLPKRVNKCINIF